MGVRGYAAGATLMALSSLVAAACSQSSSSDECVRPASEVDLPALFEAVEPFCEQDDCAIDYSDEECRYYIPLDFIRYALLAEEPARCIEASIDELRCLTDSPGCASSDCAEERDAIEVACATTESPRVAEPFDGAGELCARQAACVFDGMGPGAEEYELERAACLADQAARVWLVERRGECACELADFLGCLGRSDLACDADDVEEDAACPEESAAYNTCVGGSICRDTGGSGAPDGCTSGMSCGGVHYELSCESGACTCTVDGEPGPVTKELQAAYFDVVKGEATEYDRWLTYVD